MSLETWFYWSWNILADRGEAQENLGHKVCSYITHTGFWIDLHSTNDTQDGKFSLFWWNPSLHGDKDELQERNSLELLFHPVTPIVQARIEEGWEETMLHLKGWKWEHLEKNKLHWWVSSQWSQLIWTCESKSNLKITPYGYSLLVSYYFSSNDASLGLEAPLHLSVSPKKLSFTEKCLI